MPSSNPAGAVRAPSLLPAEVPTPLALLRQADCYQQCGLKYPQRGTFHSYAELLHFALAEGDPTVTTFVPHPFRLWVHGRPYIPDAYLVRAGVRVVVELKPRGEFDDALRLPLVAFLRFHDLQFEVVSNEAMLAREIEALNWLQVIRTLYVARALDTAVLEHALWCECLRAESLTLAELLDPDQRGDETAREVALYRLLHRGLLRADWQQTRLGPDTVFVRCT